MAKTNATDCQPNLSLWFTNVNSGYMLQDVRLSDLIDLNQWIINTEAEK